MFVNFTLVVDGKEEKSAFSALATGFAACPIGIPRRQSCVVCGCVHESAPSSLDETHLFDVHREATVPRQQTACSCQRSYKHGWRPIISAIYRYFLWKEAGIPIFFLTSGFQH